MSGKPVPGNVCEFREMTEQGDLRRTVLWLESPSNSDGFSFDELRIASDICTQFGSYRLSLQFTSRMIELCPSNWLSYARASENLFELGSFRKSLLTAERALNLFPGNQPLIKAAARAAAKLKKKERLEILLQMLLEISSDAPSYRFALLMLHLCEADNELQSFLNKASSEPDKWKVPNRLNRFIEITRRSASSIHLIILTTLQPISRRTLKRVKSAVRRSNLPESSIAIVPHIMIDAKSRLSGDEHSWPAMITENSDLIDSFNIHFSSSENGFDELRNKVFSFVPLGDWILMIDDDELFYPGFLTHLVKRLESDCSRADVVYVPRLNSFCETWQELSSIPDYEFPNPGTHAYPDYQGRIIRNTGFVRYSGTVHEQPVGGCNVVRLPLKRHFHLIHHKTTEMQARTGKLWRTLEIPTDLAEQSVFTGTRHPAEDLPHFTSQCHEDEVFLKIIAEIPNIPKSIIEIGAGEPETISNSWVLINKHGWAGLLIEPNPVLAESLRKYYSSNKLVEVIESLVSDRADTKHKFHISKIHWALSGIGGVSQPERHADSDVEIVELATATASTLIASSAIVGAQKPRDSGLVSSSGVSYSIGIISIDAENHDTVILRELLGAGVRPVVYCVESLNEIEFRAQDSLLKASGYRLYWSSSLSKIWVAGSALSSSSEVIQDS